MCQPIFQGMVPVQKTSFNCTTRSLKPLLIGARTADFNVREVSNRMRELENNIKLKEDLIEDLQKSEKEARATSSCFRIRYSF